IVNLRYFRTLLLLPAFAASTATVIRAQAANYPELRLETWRKALLSGDSAALSAQYVSNPRVFAPKQTPSNLKSELEYWNSWKGRGLKAVSVELEGQQEPQPGFHVLMTQLTMTVSENGAAKKYFVKIVQGYIEQGATWKIAAEQRDAETRLKGPAERKDLYPAEADAEKEITEALQTAARAHKRVLLIFGGNWCYDCHVLDEAFHLPEIAPTLNRNFVVAHIDIGEYNKNLEIAKKYEVPVEKGVPAAAGLGAGGDIVAYSKKKQITIDPKPRPHE